jgi:hypothetical protein
MLPPPACMGKMLLMPEITPEGAAMRSAAIGLSEASPPYLRSRGCHFQAAQTEQTLHVNAAMGYQNG